MYDSTLRSACALAAASCAWYSTLSYAAIVGGNVTGGSSGGVFQQISPPPDVAPNLFQSPNLIAFNELQDLEINSETIISPSLTLQPGDTISSHYVVFDPNIGSTLQGLIEFDEPIIALIQTSSMIDATSPLFGAPVTNYTMTPGFAPELSGNDSVIIDPSNRHRLQVRAMANISVPFIDAPC